MIKKLHTTSNLALLAFVVLMIMPGRGWGQILTFEFDGIAGNEASVNSNSNNANLTSSTISRGAGLTSSQNTDRFNASNWAITSIANAISGNKYMEFTITPNSGYQFSVSSIDIQWQRSSTGNTAISLRSSINSYSTDLDAVKNVTDGTTTQTFTWTFTQANSSSAVTYRLYSYAESSTGTGGPGDGTLNDIVVNGSTSSTGGSASPTLNSDATLNNVDNNIDITFADDATWRGAVTAVKIGGTALTVTTDYVLTAGNMQLKPSGLNVLLTTSGSKAVTVEATGYTTASVTQQIDVGAAAKLGMKTQPTAPATNGAVLATQPAVYIQDQYANTTTSTAAVVAAVGAGTWTLGGTTSVAGVAGTTTYSGLTATSAAAVTGATITFTSGSLSGITSAGFNIPVPVVNDECSNAVTITPDDPAISGSNVGATKSSPTGLTALAYTTGTAKDVWYTFTPTCTGSHTITVSPTGFDVAVALFSGGTCPNPTYTSIADANGSGAAESITASLTIGITYRVLVWGYNSASGVFTIGVTGPTPVTQTVTAQAATLVTTTTATLNGNLTAIGVCPATTEKGFVYAVTTTNPDPLVAGTGVTKTTVASITTGAYTLALTGLTPGTGYSFKSYVYDGSSYTYGAVTTFTTLLVAPTVTAATGATVDAPFEMTFAENSAWRGAITGITVGGTSLTLGYSTAISGVIRFTPSASNPTTLLQTAGAAKSFVITATGYPTVTVSQTIGAGVATKLIMKTQPTAPATNGAVLAQQPAVYIEDQYGNFTTSTATVAAAVGAGTWTLGGTTSVAGVSGTTTFSGLTATSAAAVTGATIAFTSSGLTGVTSNTFNIIAPVISLSASANQTVDNNFNITFTDNASWRTAVTGITVDGTSYLAASGVYSLTSGSLVLTTASITQLQTAGSHIIVVIATGYTNATVTQTNIAGVATKLAMKTQPAAPATNGAVLATQPAVYIKDQYNNTTTSTASVVAAVGAGTWSLGGTTSVAGVAGTTTYSGLTASCSAAVTDATIAFSSTGLTGITSSLFSIPVLPAAPTSLAFGNILYNSFTSSFTAPGTAPTGYLVLRSVSSAVTGAPVAGTAYTLGQTNIGSGINEVVYVGASAWSAYAQTGLTDNTTYYYAIYSYNGSAATTSYSAAALTGSQTTAIIAAPTAGVASSILSDGFTANWEVTNPDYIVPPIR